MSILRIPTGFDSTPRNRSTIAALIVLIALGLIGWRLSMTAPAAGLSATPSAPRTMTIAATPLVVNLNEIGVIEPYSRAIVAAPFDGYVRERHADFGAPVKVGDPLLVMDTSEIDARFRDAESGLLKAAMQADSLSRWETGSDMLRAKRSLANANAQLTKLVEQMKQSKTLFDRGIIAKSEVDGAIDQVGSQRDSVISAQQDLDTTLARGNASNRRLAELDLASAKAHIADIDAQRRAMIVRAATDGILIHPPVASSTDHPNASAVEGGSHLTRGQALFAIANLERLVVAAKVDEVDVDQLHVGQDVTIESDSFPGDLIHGELIAVNGEADEGSGGSAQFSIKAAFRTDEKRRSMIRIGMSARLTITTYANPNAIVVPQEAVSTLDGRPTLRVIDPKTGHPQAVAVALGAPVPTGIEITHGLAVGDEILLP